MCNFSEAIEENALKKGIEQQTVTVVINMYDDGFDVEKIAKLNGISIDVVKSYLSQRMVSQQ